MLAAVELRPAEPDPAALLPVDRVRRFLPAGRVEMLDSGVFGVGVDAAVAGGADSLVVDEFVDVALVVDAAEDVGGAALVDVGAGEQGMRRVGRAPVRPGGARVAEVVGADDERASRVLNAGGLRVPVGAETQVDRSGEDPVPV